LFDICSSPGQRASELLPALVVHTLSIAMTW